MASRNIERTDRRHFRSASHTKVALKILQVLFFSNFRDQNALSEIA